MKQGLRFWSAGLCLALLVVVGCSRAPQPVAKEAEKAVAVQYPAPRFPSYLQTPHSVDDILPSVRALVRNKSGFQGGGLGVVNKGEKIALVTSADAEDLVVQAIQKALEERGVKAVVLRDYELVGVSRQDVLALRKLRQNYTAEQGYLEAAGWIQYVFANPEVPKKWLKEQRPDLFDKLFPKNLELSPHMEEVRQKMRNVGPALRDYVGKHPELKGVFWGKGGGTSLRKAIHPAEDKLLGLFTTDNHWDAMSQIGSYPDDVWELSEERTLEPLPYTDKLQATDPAGTDVHSEITAEMAERWAKGAYQRGHLYMFPNQATGRFGYSVVDYPAFQKEWLPREPMALLNGVIAGTNGHGGFYPQWQVYVKDGYIVDVKGGGTYGDVLREFLKYPKINELTYPFHKHPGFWWMYEIAFGTHPKAFRNPDNMQRGGFGLGPERLRSGVIHWGLGMTLQHDPGSPELSKSLLEFTAKNDMPRDHNFHTHTYFTTYKLHLRNTDKWVTLVDKGRLTSLDDPEIRALASRYGDPNSILGEDWIPEVPGINVPGRYADFARDPWSYAKAQIDRVENGTYAFLYPKGKPAPIDYHKVHAASKPGAVNPE